MRLVIISVVVIGLVVGGFMGYRLYDRHVIQQEFRGSAAEIVNNLPVFMEAHDEVLGIFDQVHDEAFDDGYDFGGLVSQAEFDEDTYQKSVIRRAWRIVEGRDDMDPGKLVVYMLVTTRYVTIDGQPLPRNSAMEAKIREVSPG